MARRVLDRKKLRSEAEAVESAEAKGVKVKKTAKSKEKEPKDPSAVKVKKVRAKKVKLPPRMRARWCIFDGGMKQVALFDYNQLSTAKARLAEYLEKKPSYFMQLVKEPLPVSELEQGAS